jgi:hypothetical protein
MWLVKQSTNSSSEMGTQLRILSHISLTRTSNSFARYLKQPFDKEYEQAVRAGLRIRQPSLHDLPKFFYRNFLESLVFAQCI